MDKTKVVRFSFTAVSVLRPETTRNPPESMQAVYVGFWHIPWGISVEGIKRGLLSDVGLCQVTWGWLHAVCLAAD